MSGKAFLVLSDGIVFEGKGFGHEGEALGEVVFNTSITGYQEILTDPSYKGQIVTMTYSQIGNYGINQEDIESFHGPTVEGFVIKECIDFPSNWRSSLSLGAYLRENKIVCIEGVDTRALTRHLRDHGAQMGIISMIDPNPESLLEKVREHPGISACDLVKEVTTKKTFPWNDSVWNWQPNKEKVQNPNSKFQSASGGLKSKVQSCENLEEGQKNSAFNILHSALKKVVVYDFGVKLNILRNLVHAGFDVTVVPAQTPPEEVLNMDPDGIILSNGPGDPETVTYAISNTKKLIGKKPIFGICLGHQILGLAMGGRTYKLKFGHHGGNHPVKDLSTGRVEITSQNHNYCVDINSLQGQVKLTHKNLYDGTEEGMMHVELPVFSVQHHPEAGPGPHDAAHIFNKFREFIEKN